MWESRLKNKTYTRRSTEYVLSYRLPPLAQMARKHVPPKLPTLATLNNSRLRRVSNIPALGAGEVSQMSSPSDLLIISL